MDTIVLRNDLREMIERDAQQESKSVSDLVNEAVERYLQERHLASLDAEIEAYKRMHPDLRQNYLGQWIAVHSKQLVDHDSDGTALYKRIRAKYGKAAVLIRQVTEQADEDLWFRKLVMTQYCSGNAETSNPLTAICL